MVNGLRGSVIKTESGSELRLERRLLGRRYTLQLRKNLCNGCGICVKICPKEAVEVQPASVVEGRLIRKTAIDFDTNSCILCGECVVLCPLNALRMEVDGEEIATIVKNEAFPVLLKEISVDKEKCEPECEIRCQEECPTDAIEVSTEISSDGKVLRITDVRIDESRCVYCKRCELACPFGALRVGKPFQGTLELRVDLCPDGCRACVDICPARAVQLSGSGKPMVSQEFCVFCSACQQICPKEAIKVRINWVVHSDIRSAVWLTALKRLTSPETVAKELVIKSGERQYFLVRNRENIGT